MLILNGDCLELLKEVPDESIDLIFCDLPYGQTSCKWDCKIDLDKLWIEFMRVKKLNTPLFFTTTTKFGVELINSAPKKCFFRYDIVWVKSAPAGFLSAKKMPMRKHEMVYVFYEKLPFYDLSSHKHKFIKEENSSQNKEDKHTLYGDVKEKGIPHTTTYDPPLPTSVIKDDYNSVYNNANKTTTPITKHPVKGQTTGQPRYDPPLPTSVVKEEDKHTGVIHSGTIEGAGTYGVKRKTPLRRVKKGEERKYDPPLPTSVVKEGGEYKHIYGDIKDMDYQHLKGKMGNPVYEPPLPTSICEIQSTRGKHSTEKPVKLMEWILKYYSKEGDVILDPTMGSGSMGCAAVNLNRDFVGFEKDDEIFDVAYQRIMKV